MRNSSREITSFSGCRKHKPGEAAAFQTSPGSPSLLLTHTPSPNFHTNNAPPDCATPLQKKTPNNNKNGTHHWCVQRARNTKLLHYWTPLCAPANFVWATCRRLRLLHPALIWQHVATLPPFVPPNGKRSQPRPPPKKKEIQHCYSKHWTTLCATLKKLVSKNLFLPIYYIYFSIWLGCAAFSTYLWMFFFGPIKFQHLLVAMSM